MSSILIKGVKMPKYKPICIVIDAAGQARRYDLNNDRYADDKLFEAVPVPPHGRLIDADALADDFRGFIAMYDGCPFSQLSPPDKARRDELQAALTEVINAPTIIPAEEGEA